MTHIPGKRPLRAGVVLDAVAGLAAAPGLGTVGEAQAAAPGPAAQRWADRPHGFASPAGGTGGGAEPVRRGSIPRSTTGRHDTGGAAFDPRDFSAHRLDAAAAVPALVHRFSGPQRQPGTVPHAPAG
jgi:transposase